jgi:ribosomal protein S27E
MKKSKKKAPEPTTHKVVVFCVGCEFDSFVFLTNREIWSDTFIKQYCNNCGRMMPFVQRKG